MVPYEVVPHRDRWPLSFRMAVQEYSRHVDHDVIAVADGAALIHMGSTGPLTDGAFTRYQKGQIIES
jgi:hypothetical protein